MQRFRLGPSAQNHAMAALEARALSFPLELPSAAIIEDLAARLAHPRRGMAGWADQASDGAPPKATELGTIPVDDNVSPYLQQPLRTFEQARDDRRRRRREVEDAETKRNRTE